jgi:isoleucyl-tRNA synthetase
MEGKAKHEKSKIAQREEQILKFWKDNNIFQKSVEKEAPNGDYVFYDGPPFATGAPHYGHLVASAMKDAVPRYWTMRGFKVERQWGWDCHGLPIENIVEKELGTKSKKDIEEMGVAKFNNLCREKIFTYVDEWNKFIPRFGRWADMESPYQTMDKDYMESEWWAFKELYDKKLVYEDYRSMHICPRCETTLAQSEVAEGYKTIKDLAVTVAFPLKDEPDTSFLAWTTTAWTLPGNVALAVGNNINYAIVEKDGKKYILAKESLEKVFNEEEYKIVEEIKGKDLVGKEYIPPFDSYINDGTLEHKENAWKVYAADFVTTETGTGIAHEAPAFGAEDMELAQSVGLPMIKHVGMDGVIKTEVKELAGLSVKPSWDHQSTDVAIIKYLAEKGILFAKEKYEHSYPHCWRCDTPLINYATSSWFVAVQKIKDQLLDNAKKINWSPSHIKEGRWGDWLEGARDWSISRQRFWANTIPVWRCEACKSEKVFGSAEELEKASGVSVKDLHKEIVDEIAVPCECGKEMKRVPDVLDTWFNSGSVPYASHHYPFENEGKVKMRIPADFIAEGQDQVSKWFYYQHVLAGGLFKKPAFNNVIVNGIVLAEDGKKMSKRLQNYPDPSLVVDKYGADAVRLYLLSSPVVRAENLNFSEQGVDEVAKKVIGRLDNVVSFYKLYKDSLEHGLSGDSKNMLDRWILARMYQLHKEVTKSMDAYEIDRATRPLIDFVDDLSTWYVRRSRDRFKSDDESDKKVALETLRWVIRKFLKVAAPFTPFISDIVWQEVRGENEPESVHLAKWCDEQEVDDEILEKMEKVRGVVSLALEARDKAGVKVRQPLSTLKISENITDEDLLKIIADEVNVKEVVFDGSLREGVGLDVTITSELEKEGHVREIIRAVQNLRKKNGLQPGEEATLVVEGGKEIIEGARDEIMKTAALSDITFVEIVDGEEVNIGKEKIKIALQ